MNGSQTREVYRPDIDGLRTLAVVPVILFHAGLGCPGGFVGVDVFFVISGYLITKIIQRDLAQHRFSVLKFYQRRIRRIFPALFAMFLACCCLGLYLLPPFEYMDLGKGVMAGAAFVSNIRFFRHTGYFDTSSQLQPLLHTWTLSVEEQFYIFWPLMLAGLSTRWLAKWKHWVILFILTGSLILSAYWVSHTPNAAFYLLPSRAWELGLGALLSIAPFSEKLQRMPRWVANAASVTGLAMLVGAITLYDSLLPFPGIAALLPCVGAALLIASGEGGRSLGGRVLSLRPLVWIGLISYSLYLWHWPILIFARLLANGGLDMGQSAACIVLIFGVSWLSWRFVERPFRDPAIMGGKSGTWVLGGLATTALFIGFGAVIVHAGGFPRRSPEVASWVAEQENEASTIMFHSPCFSWNGSLPPKQGCILGTSASGSDYRVVLWGDSHAAHLSPSFSEMGQHLGIASRQITKAGCPPLMGIRFVPEDRMNTGCPAFNDNALKEVLGDQKVQVVVLAARWIPLAMGSAATPIDGLHPSLRDSRALFIASLRKTVETLVSSGRQVILVGQVPGPELSPVLCLSRARLRHANEGACTAMAVSRPAEQEALVNQSIAEAVRGIPAVQIVHPYNVLCGRQSCQLISRGQPLYSDETHLSATGAHMVEGEIEKSVAAALMSANSGARLAPASLVRLPSPHP